MTCIFNVVWITFYLKSSCITGGIPVVLPVKAAEVTVSLIDTISGKKALRNVKIIIGKAIASIIMTMTKVLLSTAMLFYYFNMRALKCLILL